MDSTPTQHGLCSGYIYIVEISAGPQSLGVSLGPTSVQIMKENAVGDAKYFGVGGGKAMSERWPQFHTSRNLGLLSSRWRKIRRLRLGMWGAKVFLNCAAARCGGCTLFAPFCQRDLAVALAPADLETEFCGAAKAARLSSSNAS